MTYYRIIDSTNNHGDRNYLLDIGAYHISTITLDNNFYREFALDMTEDELLIAKLSLNHTADISPLNEEEMLHLKDLGYLK